MKSRKSLFFAALLIGVGFLGFHAYSVWPRLASQPEIIATKPIGQNQKIGGVAATPQPSNSSADPQKQSQSSPTTNSVQPIANTVADVAPRQAEIKRSIATEYVYQALKTSNDPLPQPSWVNSTLKTQTAWDSSTGNGVVVAVIDTGFGLNHEDLTNQWYQNSAETGNTSLGGRCWTGTAVSKQSNNCDDDNNGYVDDWRGWDFVAVNNSPQAGDTNPTGAGVSHGTEVAGLVGATGNNGVGTATVSWNNRIMPLQALDDNGSGFTSTVVSAVYYAVDNGASVINLSLGGTTNDTALANAIKYAYNHNVVVVAAAGNCGTGTEQGCDASKPGAMSYPALNPYVIAVGAVSSTNARASFSSYGPGLDAVAPGSGTMVSPMWSPSNQTSAYASSLYGTSFASPTVASYVGLLKSIRPSSSVDDITALVDATASKTVGMSGNVFTNQYGHGIVDAANGLLVASNLNSTPAVPELLQAGSSISEHSYGPSSTLGSGCKGTVSAYCTVWARNSDGYDRFLPYGLIGGAGSTGWSWTSSWLGDGDWSLKARSGSQISTTPYNLTSR